MCELVIMVSDREPADHRSFVRGDVIAAGADGTDWGREGGVHPQWRTLRLPHVTVSDVASLLSSEVATDPQNPSARLQRRGFRLDLDAMPAGVQAWLADDTRATPVLERPWVWGDLVQYRYQVEALPDPTVL